MRCAWCGEPVEHDPDAGWYHAVLVRGVLRYWCVDNKRVAPRRPTKRTTAERWSDEFYEVR